MRFTLKQSSSLLVALAAAMSLAACGGGAGTPGIPMNSTLTPNQGETTLSSMSVNSSQSGDIMHKVTGASAYYKPMAGQSPRHIVAPGNHAVQTMGAMDLTYYGGPYQTSATEYDIYVNCSSTCWGNPGTFLGRLANSNMIHITDQYVHQTGNGRYPYAGGISESYNTNYTLQDQDIYNIVYAAAKSYGTGYGREYHVFLASGVQQCSQSAGGCYAQQYCAYHGSVDFSDIGHTIYSVEPYQGINGCMTPSGRLSDASASTLSHELFESITDTDVAANNLAWYNNTYGEIGDECAGNDGNVSVSGYTYNIQREYSNRYHACTFSP